MPIHKQSPTPRDQLLVAFEILTGAAAIAGEGLLFVRPDGSLLHASPSAFAGSPFSDRCIPGLLLATLVAGGLLLAAAWQQHQGRHARELSMFAWAGLIAFECVELVWIGFQPLEVLSGVVGAAIFAISRDMPRVATAGAEHAPTVPALSTLPTRPGLDLYWIPFGQVPAACA